MPASFKDKLIGYEVQPPAAAWENIARELVTNNELLTLSNKLYDYEVVPPPGAWNTISNNLNKGDLPQIDSAFQTRRKRILSYAMLAAAVVSGIVFGIIYIQHDTVRKNQAALSVVTNSNNKLLPEPSKSISPPLPLQGKPGLQYAYKAPVPSISRMNKTFASNKVLHKAEVQSTLFPGNEFGIMIAAKPIRNANGEIIQNPGIINNPGSKYISITAPNGAQTKISSKFLHLLLFLNDANDIDQVDGYFDKHFLESLIWKSRFQDWRNEIINTSFVPSSTNFMDIFELKELIMKDRH